jgi:integrase
MLEERIKSRLGQKYLFESVKSPGEPRATNAYQGIKAAAKRAGVGHWFPHLCRHTFGHKLAQANLTAEKIGKAMGHKKGSLMALRYITLGDNETRTEVSNVLNEINEKNTELMRRKIRAV